MYLKVLAIADILLIAVAAGQSCTLNLFTLSSPIVKNRFDFHAGSLPAPDADVV
jgi:hypothetical protein